MHIPKDDKEQQAWMLNLLINHYGVRGHVIDPVNHVSLNDLPVPEEPPKKSKKPEARVLKSNERLYEIVSYLQREYSVFKEGMLFTDCPIHPWFGKTSKADWVYAGVFRIIPREHGYLAATCTESGRCQWRWCPIHPSMPLAKQQFDPFDLLQVLNSIERSYHYPSKYGNIADYAEELAKAFGIEAKRLRAEKGKSPSGLGRGKGKRYPVNKNQLLIEITSTVPANDKEVEALVDRVCKMAFWQEPEWVFDRTSSASVVWLPKNAQNTLRQFGPAVRLWLYIWTRQQQEKGRVVVNVQDFADVLRVNSKAIYRYRGILEKLSKLTRKIQTAPGGQKIETWTVKP
jgi:hypothetical protein